MSTRRSKEDQQLHKALIEYLEANDVSIAKGADLLCIPYSKAKSWWHRHRKAKEREVAEKIRLEEYNKGIAALTKGSRVPHLRTRAEPLDPDAMTGDVRKHWREGILLRLQYLATPRSVEDPNQAKIANTLSILIDKCPAILDRWADENEVAADTAAQMERVRAAFKLPATPAPGVH